jgi:hypothetical protein
MKDQEITPDSYLYTIPETLGYRLAFNYNKAETEEALGELGTWLDIFSKQIIIVFNMYDV